MPTSHGRIALPAAPKGRRQEYGRYQGETEDRARLLTVVSRLAAGVAVEYESPVTHDTHLIPSRWALRSTGEAVLGNPQSVAMHTASYTPWVFRSTSSSANLQDRAKDYGARKWIHATFLPRCYKRKCKRNIVEPTSPNEVRFLRSRHLQHGEADSQERRRSDY